MPDSVAPVPHSSLISPASGPDGDRFLRVARVRRRRLDAALWTEASKAAAEEAAEVIELAELTGEARRLRTERVALHELCCQVRMRRADLEAEEAFVAAEAADGEAKRRVVTAPLAAARVLAARSGDSERIEGALARCEELIAATGAYRFSADVRDLRDRGVP